ncbi:MAG: preprotein translocase subunit SecG [Nitrospirae bacterium]|nr:preprotein translocase subunit SecG [Nitrospirota bacterium]
MYTFLVIIHLFVCFFLIFVVLIQSSKGASMGTGFGGGSSQTLFGGRGATTFLAKMTTATAILFMITSLTLAFYSVKKESIVSDMPPVKEQTSAPLTETAGPLTTAPSAGQQGDATSAPVTNTPQEGAK